MKKSIFSLLAAMALLGAACEDDYKNYPDGYDRQYYTTFDYESDDQGNPTLTNRTISVDRSSTELIELPVKFMSEIERDYDIEVRLYVRNSPYFLTQMGVMKPPKNEFSTPDSLAVPGVDFHILDRDKRVMTPVRTDTLTYYSVIFPRARKGVEKLYIELLNNEDFNHLRCAWLTLAVNKIDATSEQTLQQTAVNHDAGHYRIYSLSRCYFRRLNIQ